MRPERWPMMLDQYIRTSAARPFAWGVHDCCTFAAGWIGAMRGERIDIGEYDDARGAMVELGRRGGIIAAITDVLGAPYPRPLMASRGDVGIARTGGRVSAVVVTGTEAFGPGEYGLQEVSLSALMTAWRV